MDESSLTPELYTERYQDSLKNPEKFWAEEARKRLTWFSPWNEVLSGSLEDGTVRWFSGGILNACYNCIDRHIEAGTGDSIAYHFEGNDGASTAISYITLGEHVGRLANALKARGVKKGDRVCIYMPMIPEAIYAMLACARIGAVHAVVFGGFSAEALKIRIHDSDASCVITADVSTRGEKIIPLAERVYEILPNCPNIHTVLVVSTHETVIKETSIIKDYNHTIGEMSTECPPEHMDAEDPLFILYTSGSTGTPKGVLHTTGGYLLYAALTHQYSFDHKPDDIYWCTADIGWITGHTYVVYGPLLNHTTSVIFEGVPTHPTPARYWEIVDTYKITTLSSTPTTIRMLMAYGDTPLVHTARTSLRILGTVGEPINPEAWRWYHEKVGNSTCHIVDTWWQTETGGHALAPLPGVVEPKPGAAMLPHFGIEPVIIDEHGIEIEGPGEGSLLLKRPWPGMMRDIYGNHERFLDTYLRPHPGYYTTGDGARRDEDGHLWITGRIDDTMNIAGRLIGTAEVESALVVHPSVAEAAVVAVPDQLTGSSIYAYVTLVHNKEVTTNTTEELAAYIKKHVGSFIKPKKTIYVRALPKTRSGKIMRRVLRKIAEGHTDSLGDLSTLAEPEVIDEIIAATNK